MNDYFNGPNGINDFTRARAGDVRANFQAVADAFDKLPALVDLERPGPPGPPGLGAILGVTPEQFGAKGDGVANDTAALIALSAYINARGGGLIEMAPGATYLIGDQTATVPPLLKMGLTPLRFLNCTKGIIIRGNGATIKCRPGMLFGTFNETTLAPIVGFGTQSQVCTPYRRMVEVADCVGVCSITDLEIDGNMENHVIGGQYGDVGYQIEAYGIEIANNRGPVFVNNVRSHDHCLDGMKVTYATAAFAPDQHASGTISNSRFTYNGRNNLTIGGGKGWTVSACAFNFAGRGAVSSNPKSGCDIESEDGPIRGVTFHNCEFMHNQNTGVVSDTGARTDVSFHQCRFWSDTAACIYLANPGFRFHDCVLSPNFVIVGNYGAVADERAAQFSGCLFTDDATTYSLNGLVDPGPGILNSRSVVFSDTRFEYMNNGITHTSPPETLYRNCTLRQVSATVANPNGTYSGNCTIAGAGLVLSNSLTDESVTINGSPGSREGLAIGQGGALIETSDNLSVYRVRDGTRFDPVQFALQFPDGVARGSRCWKPNASAGGVPGWVMISPTGDGKTASHWAPMPVLGDALS